ncbi:hypothetical protein GDO78_016859 [Eleutherodactylus coqui]|uniref:Core Histone H2A/H2B/H3 domain-containing protein n=1 Tax=Eleutherodactylus coqui TaxID=57060 RepID=A0A8J6EJX8_ELECQ|nr:hypothetical protein GDO78_016859 [Eleutherodactylus coqui]
MDFTCGVLCLWQRMEFMALQEVAEAFIVRLYEDTCLCCLRSKRVTLFAKDILLTQIIYGIQEGLGSHLSFIHQD